MKNFYYTVYLFIWIVCLLVNVGLYPIDFKTAEPELGGPKHFWDLFDPRESFFMVWITCVALKDFKEN